ncbi:protein spire homolog 1-like isoform X6 [Phyllopteryx taeniolatus]|uniref:protein spire homolog 1-like isoform X6 n=1 Tax=Phyllopteryx taeniolatus TaxID=161469 RepID=UPI002AD2E0E4|nr:protein spire homolog 1-like isoform X6 [Phyllopteryx taeniolatus]
MSKRPGTDDGLQSSPSVPQCDFAGGGDVNMDATAEKMEKMDVSLAEILALYSQPLNEEQAWAVCYQCCRTLEARRPLRKGSKSGGGGDSPRRIEGPGDVRIGRDGTVTLRFERTADKYGSAPTSLEVIDSLGVMIYKALDYGLKENEERELSPPLEHLIDMMTNAQEAESDDACPDEGYEATEEEEEEEEEEEQLAVSTSGGTISQIRSYRDLITLCSSHLPSPSDAPDHYQAVCRALYAESGELRTFLEKIKSAKENLRKMEGETHQQPVRDLDELQNADWARFWVQVMRDLRHGVKLKKVQERQYNPLPIEYQLTPYEMLMDDIRSKRYKLRKVMVNGDIPPRLKKSAHEVILEFIRSRPPLNPVSARKLKPTPPRPQSLHERLLEDIKTERKLRPVSPDLTRRTRLGAGKSISTPHDLCRTSDTPDAPRKLATSTQSLARGSANQMSQRKRLLHAPTLAELESSDSDEETTRSSSSATTSLMDISPDSTKGVKSLPAFLPVSATPLPDKRQPSASLRRHSIEKEAPANAAPFVAPSRQSSKSLLMDNAGKVQAASSAAQGTEEFRFPVECLALTVEEVMHIRQVLVKAELEKFQQYKDVYNALKKGKLCFSCRAKRFSFFTWSYTCQFCKRPVCSQCSTKIRLPSKPYATLPIYTLGPSASAKDEAGASSASSESFGSARNRRSLRRSVYKFSKSGTGDDDGGDDASPPTRGDLDLPEELTEDWASMEVCVDCKKFITEIISSSKRSLCVASKRARLHRRTRSFYRSSSASVDFRRSPRIAIHEA